MTAKRERDLFSNLNLDINPNGKMGGNQNSGGGSGGNSTTTSANNSLDVERASLGLGDIALGIGTTSTISSSSGKKNAIL